jgi:hypothetical protein
MKTLTITDAKKNLGHWLTEAAKGNDIGIISGSDIIALRKVEVESTDYAYHEYGARQEQVQKLADWAERRYQKQNKAGKVIKMTPEKIRKMLEKTTKD